MGKKAKTKPAPRKPNFPLIFWDGLREKADAAAADDYGGNLTTYINATIQADVKARAKKGK